MRPIVAAIGSPTYFLAKDLARILSPMAGRTSSYMINSAHFVETIKKTEVGAGDILVSFDVISLFTKIPIDEAMEVLRQKLQDDTTLYDRTPISAEMLCNLTKLCLISTYFQLGGDFYEQREGTAMGSSLSPIIANICIEKLALDTSPLQPKLWLRYVDDTFVIWPHGEVALHAFLQHLNGVRESIQFTMETESNKRISFLDIQVQRENNNFITSVFRKKTHTDRYLNYNSHHHPGVLAGVVKCLRLKAANIWDHECEQAEVSHLKQIFQANGYPSDCIEPILNKRYGQHHVTSDQTGQVDDEREHVLCLPYVRGVSERIDRVCKSLTTVKIKVVFKPIRILRHILTNVKNNLPSEKKKGVVYTVPCIDCGKKYVGETGRTLQERIEEHKAAVRKGDERNGIAVHVRRPNMTLIGQKPG